MNCPKDHSPMIVVEHDRIALDYCPECRGVWFDRGELELLMELACGGEADACTADLLTRPEATTAEARRRCPICNHNMRKEHIGQQPAVLIDSCGRGDGLWFDGGELHQVLSQFQAGVEGNQDARLLDFLKETLKADINE
ncbi:Transcription factor zinc-finger [Dehalogenimonas alkenigignens]|uniref:Transcription factor zinc-finger n=1 Tax=Dehalogenimonas alkenigignens TaxID=1217799 RepID=A0A0W0GK77_9CHLR|nr:zf-TFIIB domain-containing protein [Dehalogenimonas alkenigignens]KTB48942.1 Transcription factor zinc-finger [Dehalogenimonas alkenigignens]